MELLPNRLFEQGDSFDPLEFKTVNPKATRHCSATQSERRSSMKPAMERLAAIGCKMVFLRGNAIVKVTKRGNIYKSKNTGIDWKLLKDDWFEMKRGF